MIGRVARYNVAAGGVLAACLIGVGGAAPPPSRTCATSECHAEIKQHQRLHQPVLADRCELCHEPVAGATPFQSGPGHEFKRASDNAELCYTCHDRLAEQAHVHEPVRLGLCVLCHDPHGGRGRFFLRVQTDRQLCMQCHRQEMVQGDNVHGPVSIGACGACHDPHQSPNRFRLRGVKTEPCGMCHTAEVRAIMASPRIHPPVAQRCSNCHEPHSSTNPFRLINRPPTLCFDCHENIERQVTQGQVVHKPVADGACGDCHEYHGGRFRRLLRRRFTAQPYEPFDLGHYELCYGCHKATQVTERITTDATGFRNGKVNLHFVHVHQAEKGRTCNMCHEVHASGRPKLVRETTPFGAWQLPLNFRKTPTGGSCLPGCHRRRGYDRVQAVANE